MQQVVMQQDAKRFTPLLPTHFYNTDTESGKFFWQKVNIGIFHGVLPGCFFLDYLLSTTRKDFKPPAEALTS